MREGVFQVLVVDDDANVRDVLRRYLIKAGHRVREAADGPTAIEVLRTADVDLVVLDLMLPGLGGLEVCRTLRAESDVGIVMLTALGSEDDRIAGLELGADDYVTKPFSPREVTLRVGRLLERTRSAATGRRADPGSDPTASPLVDGDLVVSPAARTATRAGRPLALTGREFDLLCYLLRHPDQALTRQQLMKDVWEWDFGDESTVTVHARRLREKIENDPARPVRLLTVWGRGYRYHPVDADPADGPARPIAPAASDDDDQEGGRR
ncbi:DNA-binding response OmpR family regulator [Friedmanniella endophytica]|uniref:DNA-binding response OmpR family regulator n=1 Tax=Microlunatus kandeliicorticis TaxID=1759536 RepID=A0A7W3IRJ9_9ACTN|nr:response regulator transcription factor [Microlunatus kandeliicorticis]MBA8793958.1 DNA-binding response OmpR family regulator [Microlunatus kandeliicorticis]